MGVATRGVKFKFSSGEKVLCYEPDSTKAKVLYESKVLDLVVSRDDRGRKVSEYLIHFFGWNNSWDRCVREEFILPFTDENRELQTKLAKEAALSLKGKRKSKLPPLIKETLGKKFCSDTGDEKIEVLENPDSGSETDSSKKEAQVRLIIPELLKLQLEEDRRCITRKNKLVGLPCSPNVVDVLEAFVKHSLAKMLCVSPPRNGKKLVPDDVQNKLSLYKEAMDGIRVYFDFTLPHLLLYRQEKSQHAALCPPAKSFRDFLKVELLCEEPPPSTPVRSQEWERGSQLQANVLPAGSIKAQVNLQSEIVSKRKRGRPKLVPVRTLRSGVKPRVQLPVKLKGATLPTLRHKAEPGEAPKGENLLPGPSSSLGRVTRGSVLLEKTPLPPPSFGCSSSHCKSSSESSGNAAAAAGLQLLRNAGLLRDMLEWRMLPPALCGQVPAAPSLVYGAQHLLRLFVKLPDLISKMNISSRKLQPLLSILEQFLVYLCEQKERLFPPSAYVDCGMK